MRHDDLWIFLEHRHHHFYIGFFVSQRDSLKGIGNHGQINRPGRQQPRIIGLRAASTDRHIEPGAFIKTKRQCLVIATVLSLRFPVGVERHFYKRRCLCGFKRRGARRDKGQQQRCK
jgi:hypothetical protein